MMLADPGGMETHLLGINRLVYDVGDEGIGRSNVVVVVVVTQRELAELHWVSPRQALLHNSLVARRAPSTSAASLAHTTLG
jgi:hypothetical protein